MSDNSMIAALRLSSHGLAGCGCQTPLEVVRRMGAMQAQDFNMAKWGVGIRMDTATDCAVQQAFDRGDFLRTHVLRPTWHFVPAADIRWMLALTAPKIKSAMRSRDRDLELDEPLFGRCNELIAAALEGGRQLTRDQLGCVIEAGGIALQVGGVAIASARINHIVMHAELDGVICSGVKQGSKHTYALICERAPQAVSLLKDEALARLARTYFSSHAPATAEDFAWWSSLTATDVRQAMEFVRGEFVQETYDGREYWFNSGDKVTVDTKGMLLLPAFDEYIIAYRDRSAVLPAVHHGRAVSSNGIFRPVILQEGLAAGLWRKTTGKRGPAVAEFFDIPALQDENAFAASSSRFAAFLNS